MPTARIYTGCPRRPNGNTRLVPALATSASASSMTSLGTGRTREARPMKSEPSSQMRGGCTTCLATFGSGVGTGIARTTTARVRNPTRAGLLWEDSGCCEGGHGTGTSGSSGTPLGFGTGRPPGIGTWVSGACVQSGNPMCASSGKVARSLTETPKETWDGIAASIGNADIRE